MKGDWRRRRDPDVHQEHLELGEGGREVEEAHLLHLQIQAVGVGTTPITLRCSSPVVSFCSNLNGTSSYFASLASSCD